MKVSRSLVLFAIVVVISAVAAIAHLVDESPGLTLPQWHGR